TDESRLAARKIPHGLKPVRNDVVFLFSFVSSQRTTEDSCRQNIPQGEILLYPAETSFQIWQHGSCELVHEHGAVALHHAAGLAKNIAAGLMRNCAVRDSRNNVVDARQLQGIQDFPDIESRTLHYLQPRVVDVLAQKFHELRIQFDRDQ